MENDTKLTSYNTFTFKSEAEMLLHIKYWDDEGEEVFKLLKSKGCTRFCYSRIWNKKGLFKTSTLLNIKIQKLLMIAKLRLAK